MTTPPLLPELQHLSPGSDAYTLALREAWLRLNQSSHHPVTRWQDIVRQSERVREWQALEHCHLQAINPLGRYRHLLVLHPQTRVGDIDVLCYPLGLTSIFGLTSLFINAGFGEPSVMLACACSMFIMLAYDRAVTAVRNHALRSFGLPDMPEPEGKFRWRSRQKKE